MSLTQPPARSTFLAQTSAAPAGVPANLPRAMAELDDILQRLFSHDGVEHLLLIGTDGLLIRQLGAAGSSDVEAPAAMTPGVVTTCASLGRAAARGEFATAAIEFSHGVGIVAALSDELLLLALVRSGVGFAPLLRDLSARRARLATLL